jgi:hypothetical protein
MSFSDDEWKHASAMRGVGGGGGQRATALASERVSANFIKVLRYGCAQIICENYSRSTEPHGSTLGLRSRHIKAKLREFVEGDKKEQA